MAEFKNISNNIKCLREANSLTQSELAKTLKTSPQAISQYERGSRNPKPQMWEQLAWIFDVPVNYVKGYETKRISNIDVCDTSKVESEKEKEQIKQELADTLQEIDVLKKHINAIMNKLN
ncbi:helix-turn-helix transcriptional regulator [Liquorilactobacillus nagelii]|uniref:helix-turn-helix transcriptional regulator n=1 Tax=Liquorilactobacillus nagelii TaxID=82688 RepID=UPI0039ECCB07